MRPPAEMLGGRFREAQVLLYPPSLSLIRDDRSAEAACLDGEAALFGEWIVYECFSLSLKFDRSRWISRSAFPLFDICGGVA